MDDKTRELLNELETWELADWPMVLAAALDERYTDGYETGKAESYDAGYEDGVAESTPDPDTYWDTADIERGAVSAEWVVQRVVS